MIRFVAYVWLGMVFGVSFLATPIKFRAESLTMPVALDVGRTTFHAFGKVEWVLTAILVVISFRIRSGFGPVDWILIGVMVLIVAAQAGWLIPRLDLRVEAVIAGNPLPPSHHHMVYAASEAAKAVTLLLLGAWTANHT